MAALIKLPKGRVTQTIYLTSKLDKLQAKKKKKLKMQNDPLTSVLCKSGCSFLMAKC